MIRIVAPHFVAGAVLSHTGHVTTRAAPILSYMIGWGYADVRAYCTRRGWKLEVFDL